MFKNHGAPTLAHPSRKTAVAIRHVHFEDLGTFEAVLDGAAYDVHYHDVGLVDLAALDPLAPDLLVVLGAPVGVYETDLYPFLALERDLITRRLASGRPLLGICLGGQQIAAAMGARVAPTGVKEIGFSALTLSAEGQTGPLRHLDGVEVLHWHGDAFDLPDGCTHLASTRVCPNQAFSRGSNLLAVQFHPEADASRIEQWLVGHAAELAGAGIDINRLRRDAGQHGSALATAASALLEEWLEGLN